MDWNWFKGHWKLLLNIATLLALAALAFAIRDQLVQTFANLAHVRAEALLLLIPIEVLNYHAQAKLYQRLFAALDEKVSYRAMLRTSLELNFVNHVFPSGGISGISYFGFMLGRLGVRVTKATLIQTMKLILLFLSFQILLFIGMFILAASGRADDFTILISGMLSVLVIAGTGIFIYVIRSQTRITAFLTPLVELTNRLIAFVRPKSPETINVRRAQKLFEEFHYDYLQLRARYRELAWPFFWALIANITEVLAIYVVYIAFDAFVNVGAVILAYAVANFAGLVSVLPGGIGIYEALMTSVLVISGIPARLSLPVTVMYRVLNTLLQVPPGYVLYHLSLRRNPTVKIGENNA